jgi:chemotaxis protein MotB
VTRRRRVEEEAHTERWLVSYADFMTLLFALFVVLFASSHHDKQTIQRVSSAVKSGFQQMQAFSEVDGAPTRLTANAKMAGTSQGGSAVVSPENSSVAPVHGGAEPGIDLAELNRKLKMALGQEIENREVSMRTSPEGFVISLHELGFFDSGEARLLPGAEEKIQRLALVLTQYGLDMRVEGHSDNVPIHNAAFNSNWDLSTARAMAVAMMLLNKSGVDPTRISIAGYAQYHPTQSNDTPEGRRANRRVDIVVVSPLRIPDAKAH